MGKSKKHTSVQDVVDNWQFRVNAPVLAIVFTSMLVTIAVLMIFDYSKGVTRAEVATVLISSGVVIAYLYWNFASTKWHIWAFENTKKENWIELKERAINDDLIWDMNNFYEKTAIRTTTQVQKLKTINDEIEKQKSKPQSQKEKLEKEFEDDLSIPLKTEYFFNRSEIIQQLIYLVFIFALCVYLIVDYNMFLGAIGLAALIYGRWREIKNLKYINNKEVQFSISNEGVFLNMENVGFVEWSDTENIILNQDENNQHLTLNVWKEEESYDVTFLLIDFGIKDYDELLRVTNIYMRRYYQKKESNS